MFSRATAPGPRPALAHGQPGGAGAAWQDEARAAEPPPVRGKRILVVDDEPDAADVLADILASDGHAVDTAPNGRVALDRLGEPAYDLVLSDIKMPEMDGPRRTIRRGLQDAGGEASRSRRV